MFGLFKKRITPEEFGFGVMQLALDHLVTHAKQSMARCFEGVNASGQDENTIGKYWEQFLIKNGVSEETQRCYITRYSHAVIQTVAMNHDLPVRMQITRGAMSVMKTGPDYDFETVFSQIEGINRGKVSFGPKIDALGSDGSGAGIARYLLAECLVPGVKKPTAFFDSFRTLTSSVGGSMGTVNRVVDHVLTRFKL